MTNFKDKANIFDDFFSKQCQSIPSNSILPSIQIFETFSRLSTVDIDSKKVLKLINGLNSYKARGHDGISIRMLKICGPLLIIPLSLPFSICLKDRISPNDWEKANVLPVYKKRNEQLVSDYHAVLLLPIFSKIFGKLIFGCIYHFLDQNCLLIVNQSNFKPGDSCIHPFIAITHNAFTCFDANCSLEIRAVFLDLSKSSDRVWHNIHMHKLKNNETDG